MGLFKKKKPWRRTADCNETSSSPIEDNNYSHHREIETYDSDAAITDYDVTDSEEESNKQPSGAATTPDGNNFSCETALPSIQDNHRLTTIIPDRRHRHFRDEKVLKRVTIAETNKVAVLKDSGSLSEPYESTKSGSATSKFGRQVGKWPSLPPKCKADMDKHTRPTNFSTQGSC